MQAAFKLQKIKCQQVDRPELKLNVYIYNNDM